LSNDRYDDDRDRDRDRKRSTNDSRRFEVPPPPRFDSSSISRSSNYDRDRSTSDIKKRLDDFPAKRDDSYSSKRDSYKSSRDDFKRELDLPRHTSSSFSGSSTRIESSSTLSKDRYADRSSLDYSRAGASRSDDRDSRNNTGKPRFLEQPTETRFNDRSTAVVTSGAWNSGGAHQAFGMNQGDIWAPKQPEDTASAWRGLDDARYDRFANNDRKAVITPSQLVDASVRSSFFSGNGTLPSAARFSNRYDNGRF